MGNSNKKNEILYNKVLENKISSVLKVDTISQDEIKDIKRFLKKKKNENLERSNFKKKFLQKDKGITTIKNIIDLLYQLNPKIKRNTKHSTNRNNFLFNDDSNEEEEDEDKVGEEREEEDEENDNNEINTENENQIQNQKYFSNIQNNESDSLSSLQHINNISQNANSNLYESNKKLNESKRKSVNNKSIQSTSTFRKTEPTYKNTKQIKSIPFKQKPQNHKIVKIDIMELKKHCFLQDVKDTYLRKTEVNNRPYFPNMDPTEKEVFEFTRKANKEPKLGDDDFLSMIDILSQPNKKKEERIHSRSPIRKSNFTTSSNYEDNTYHTNKTKYQQTHCKKTYNEKRK